MKHRTLCRILCIHIVCRMKELRNPCQIVNQISKWNFMTAGKKSPSLVIRLIIGRGWGQGAQHSQALHAWFAHVPGLRVVMPSTVADARDLLIASVLCDDPVIFIDDKWLYSQEDHLLPIVETNLLHQKPKISIKGKHITIVASGYSSLLARNAATLLQKNKILGYQNDLSPFPGSSTNGKKHIFTHFLGQNNE